MYWPKMNHQLICTVKECDICQEDQPAQAAEKMMSHPIPTMPWQSVSSDCFELNSEHYVVRVDSYSGYIDFAMLKKMSGKALVDALKPILATHGAPAEMINDHGTNYLSREFQEFAREWEFRHVPSSPHHKKSNGRVEAAVKVMKKLLIKSKKAKVDIYKSLLEWRNTVTPGSNSSPMQKLTSRRARSFLLCKEEKYIPQTVSGVSENIIERRRISKFHHDRRARDLPELNVGQPVRVKTHPQLPKSLWKPGMVRGVRGPRSYNVDVDGATYKRNRIHLRDAVVSPKPVIVEKPQELLSEPATPKKPIVLSEPAVVNTSKTDVKPVVPTPTKPAPLPPNAKTTRSGRVINLPVRFKSG